MVVHDKVAVLNELVVSPPNQRGFPFNIIPKDVLQSFEVKLVVSQHVSDVDVFYFNFSGIIF